MLSPLAQCENLKVVFLPKITTSVRGTSPVASKDWPENQDCSSSVYTGNQLVADDSFGLAARLFSLGACFQL